MAFVPLLMACENTLYSPLIGFDSKSWPTVLALGHFVTCFQKVKIAKIRNVGYMHGVACGWVQKASAIGLLIIFLRSNWSNVNWIGRKRVLDKNPSWLGLGEKSRFEPSIMTHIYAHTSHNWYVIEWHKNWSSKRCNLENGYVTWMENLKCKYKVVNLSFGLNQPQKMIHTSYMNHLWGVWVGKTPKKPLDKNLIFFHFWTMLATLTFALQVLNLCIFGLWIMNESCR